MAREMLIGLVRQEAQLATLCTEPATIALAAAQARQLTKEVPLCIQVCMSPGVMKNSLIVGLPLTVRRGPEVAAALGAMAGNAELGLQVLKQLDAFGVELAHQMLDEGRVSISCCPDRSGVYTMVRVQTANHRAEVTIEGSHATISRMVLDDVPVNGEMSDGPPTVDFIPLQVMTELSFDELLDAVLVVSPEELEEVVRHSDAAMDLAMHALQGGCPEVLLGMDRACSAIMSISPGAQENWLVSLIPQVRVLVSAAVSARMGGVPWPILTASSSGDQGIVISIPLILASRRLKAPASSQARALFLAHAVSLYVKAFAGSVSALCGAVSAGAGVAAAIGWLLGGDRRQIEGAVQTVLGSLHGMLCDGAKASCAYKCAAAAGDGLTAGYLARQDVMLQGPQGVVGRTLEETAAMIGVMANEVFAKADLVVLKRWRPEAFVADRTGE